MGRDRTRRTRRALRRTAAKSRLLRRWIDESRERFLDESTTWNRLRHRFLILIGRQPPEDSDDRSGE